MVRDAGQAVAVVDLDATGCIVVGIAGGARAIEAPRDCPATKEFGASGTSHRRRRSWRKRTSAVLIHDAELDALAQRIAGVLEEAAAVRGRGDSDDVVGVLGAEQAGRPLELLVGAERGELAAQAKLEGARHDLLQRRVGGEEAFDEARVLGIGAGELGGRRRAVRLRVAAIEREPGIRL